MKKEVEKIASEYFGSDKSKWNEQLKMFLQDVSGSLGKNDPEKHASENGKFKKKRSKSESEFETKAVVDNLEDRKIRFGDFANSRTEGILLLNKESVILFQNEAVFKMTGYHLSDRRSKPGYSFIHNEDQADICNIWTEVINTPYSTVSFRCRVRTKDKKYIWVEGTLTNQLDDKQLGSIFLTCREITECKNAELALINSERKYRELFEKMADGVYRSSHEGRFLEVNQALVNMLGYGSKEELLSIDIKTELYFQTTDRDQAVGQDLEKGISLFRLRKKDGSEIWVEDRGQYVYDEFGNTLYHEGILRDVTNRVIAEFHLKESIKETENYRNALNQSLIISTTDQYGIIQFANNNLCKLSGYNKSELEGKSHRVLNSKYHPKEYMEKLWSTILSGNVWRGELRDLKKNGDVFWMDCTIVPFKQENGKPYLFLGIAVDITMQREMLEELTNRYSELKKINTELDRFVYSVTHDLRAPLSSMMGILEITVDECKDGNLLQNLEMISGSVNKLDSFIKDILDYSINARSEVKLEEIHFSDMIKSITRDLKHMELGLATPEFEINIVEKTKMFSDRVRIEIILNNLISNAIRYQNPKNQKSLVKIDVRCDAGKCMIKIEDNGIGISPENQEKIFEIFYRVSNKSIGSGLGLYIVKEAVEKLNGELKLQSELDKGSSFTIWIPATK